MRRTGAMIAVAAFLLGANSGCGTMANVAGQDHCMAPWATRPPMPFGGLRNDLRVIDLGISNPLGGDGILLFTSTSLVDLPFSLVGDMVTLPWATYEFSREKMNPTGKYDGRPLLRERESPSTPWPITVLSKNESSALRSTVDEKAR